MEIRYVQFTQLRSDLIVLITPSMSCAGEVFQKLPTLRENQHRRWFERWCRGRRVWVEPYLL